MATNNIDYKKRKARVDGTGFKYPPLDRSKPYIRLIRFLPKSTSGKLRFELCNNVSLKPEAGKKYPIRFRALSYEWGKGPPEKVILVNDRQLLIRENLFSFLQALCDHHYGRGLGWLWADAICINQGDTKERNHQVQQMKEIYSNAQVLAWLRPTMDTTMSLICQTSRTLEAKFGPSDMDVSGYIDQDKFCTRLELWGCKSLASNLILQKAVMDFYSCSYWNRLWVKQELILPQHVIVYCDHQKVSLRSIINLYQIAYIDDPALETTLTRLKSSLWSLPWDRLYCYLRDLGQEQPTGILHCLKLFGDGLCTNYHDKVYGLLGFVAHDEISVSIEYETPIEQLFSRCLSYCNSIEDLYELAQKLNIAFFLDDKQSMCLLHMPGDRSLYTLSAYIEAVLEELQPPNSQSKPKDYLKASEKSVLVKDDTLNQRLHNRVYTRLLQPRQLTAEIDHVFLDRLRQTLQEDGNSISVRCRCLVCSKYLTPTLCRTLLAKFDDIQFTVRYSYARDRFHLGLTALDTVSALDKCVMYFMHEKYLATLILERSRIEQSGSRILYWDPYHADWHFSEPRSQGHSDVSYSVRSALHAVSHMLPADPASLFSGSPTRVCPQMDTVRDI